MYYNCYEDDDPKWATGRVEYCGRDAISYYNIHGGFCSEHSDDWCICSERLCGTYVSSQVYCSEHDGSCQDCSARISKYSRYCSRHSKRCQQGGCKQIVVSQRGNYCSGHTGYCRECRTEIDPSEYYCYNHNNYCRYEGGCQKRINQNSNHCSEHSKICPDCTTNIHVRDNFCSIHQRHKCSFSGGCQTIILVSQGNYCPDHLYECLQRCGKRINRNNSYCSEHIYGAFEEQRNELNTANNQLTIKRQEIEWLKYQLKSEMGDEEYQARVEENYPPQFRN